MLASLATSLHHGAGELCRDESLRIEDNVGRVARDLSSAGGESPLNTAAPVRQCSISMPREPPQLTNQPASASSYAYTLFRIPTNMASVSPGSSQHRQRTAPSTLLYCRANCAAGMSARFKTENALGEYRITRCRSYPRDFQSAG